VLRSEDNSFFAFPFGTNGDVPAPADYDAEVIRLSSYPLAQAAAELSVSKPDSIHAAVPPVTL
jgi:hypothetical protein